MASKSPELAAAAGITNWNEVGNVVAQTVLNLERQIKETKDFSE